MTREPLTFRRCVTPLLLVAAISYGAEQIWLIVTTVGVGCDFTPLRAAARSLVRGRSIYSDHSFVYPPTAAPLLLPLRYGSETAASHWWIVCLVSALMLAAAVVGCAAARPYRLRMFSCAMIGLFFSCVLTMSLEVGNLSVLLAPVAVGAVIAFTRDRWTLGCALLVGSLLVKPLLVPLLIVPAVRRRWRALGTASVPAAVVLIIAVVLVPGGHDFAQVLRYCWSGTNLHHANARNNLSLRGWVEAHHVSPIWGQLASVAVLVAAVAVLVAAHRRGRAAPLVGVANAAFLTTLLCGSISEVHFLLSAASLGFLQIALRPRSLTSYTVAPGLIMMCLPLELVNNMLGERRIQQTWYVAAELVLQIGCLVTTLLPVQPADSRVGFRRDTGRVHDARPPTELILQ